MKRVFVVGGANMDIQGKSHNPLRMADSNIGTVSYTYGGVGRNIAENLARLQSHTVFVSVFGDDLFAQQLKAYCISLGMDLSYSMTIPQAKTSVYLAILDNQNDLLAGIADMKILDYLDQAHLSKVLNVLTKDDLLVVDTNLSKEIIDYLLDHACCPIALDPISTTKAEKIRGRLQKLTYFKPNHLEAAILSNIPIVDSASAKANLNYFRGQGVKETIITLGENGVLTATEEGDYWYHPPVTKVVCATGAGDAFLASYLHARTKERPVTEAVKEACIVSALTLRSEETVSTQLCVDYLIKEKESYQLREERI